ncbi:MAG: dTMP kinase [Candidatus Omnitrophica bacterium]|nr:dTMP kinase [Candidatus Omnitrophota bacterium]
MASDLKKGIFITFEGPEGSGKSTQSKLLYNFLKNKGYNVVYFREPGTTKLGERVRDVLLHSKAVKISPRAEALLYFCARAQLVFEKISPALSSGKIVICDRFTDATLAYQGFGLGMDMKELARLNDFATEKIHPDITFLLDVDTKTGLSRSKKTKGFKDRIEKRAFCFHKRVRTGYLKIAKNEPARIKIFSSCAGSVDEIHYLIRKAVLDAVTRYT